MSYNKAAEEQKWKRWKLEEEKLLRKYNTPEWIINELRQYDWDDFNLERRYRQREFSNNNSMNYMGYVNIQLPIYCFEDIMNQIENESLYKSVKSANSTIQDILYLRICGYSIKEIASILSISESTVRYHIQSFKKKIKKVF